MLRSYQELVGYILQTYATDDVIVKTDAAFGRYTEPLTVWLAQYAEALVARSHKC